MSAIPLDATRVGSYLRRLGTTKPPEIAATWLECAHRAHLLTIPFENLDLHADGATIRLDPDALHDKLVRRRRGGFCYELNGAFASLLAAIGFEVDLVSCRVWMPEGELSPPFDHLALLVDLDGDRWLADVGFGDAFLNPQPLGASWQEAGRRLRTVRRDAAEGSLPTWQLEKSDGESGWTPMYVLDPEPRRLDEFLPRCRWHETSPESPFQRRVLVSRATPHGRVTVADTRLVETVDGQRRERELPDAASLRKGLTAHFSPEIAATFASLG